MPSKRISIKEPDRAILLHVPQLTNPFLTQCRRNLPLTTLILMKEKRNRMNNTYAIGITRIAESPFSRNMV